MRVAVTGANGFLGREVVAALAAGGHDVRALVRPSSVLEGWEPGERVEVRRVDPRRTDELAKQLEGIEAVIHLAAAMSGSDFGRFQETIAATESFHWLIKELTGTVVKKDQVGMKILSISSIPQLRRRRRSSGRRERVQP